jgi:hypothetical protein
MMTRKLIAALFVLGGLWLLSPSTASAYTQEEQQACQDDAFRLCGDAIPDEQRVKACLLKRVRNLSPACRRMFNQGRRHRR